MKFSERTSNQPSGGRSERISAKCWRRRPTPCPRSGVSMACLRRLLLLALVLLLFRLDDDLPALVLAILAAHLGPALALAGVLAGTAVIGTAAGARALARVDAAALHLIGVLLLGGERRGGSHGE